MPLPGLVNPNIRLPGLPAPNLQTPPDDTEVIVEQGADVADTDDAGNVLRIEHSDGSISISLDGKPIEDGPKKEKGGWFANLVDDIDQAQLGIIANDLLRGIEDDIESRRDWIEARAQGIKLLGLKIEVPNVGGTADGAPVEGMSRVRHPLLLEAVLRFQANARSELLPTDGPIKIRNDNNNADLGEDQRANALQRDLNHYLTSTAAEYYPDTDRMLLMLGFGGTSFKKVYQCPLRNRPVSETVDADDLIVNNAATDLKNAKRVTHRSYMRSSTVRRLQILGVYKDSDLPVPQQASLDPAQREERAQQGVTETSSRPEDRDREIYECYCELDIPDYEHKYRGKVSGLEVPYRVTIDVSSKEVLSIVRNFDESDDLPEARTTFVKYTFVPGFGFYDIGLLHILGNTTNAVTAAWREMLDAGMFANFPGFLFSDAGGRQNTNIFRVPPGGGALVKTGGLPISQAIMPLPYKEPGMGLMNLVTNIAETGMRLGGTSEQAVGEGRADAPVGTTLAMIDQATKVLNSVHKRMHAAQAEEFRLLVDCFRENPESFWQRNKKPAYQWDQQTFIQALDDAELVPQADPNTASQSQRMMKIVGLKQLQAANPTMYDPIAIDTAAMQAMGWSNPQQFMVPPSALQQRPPPEVQYAQAMVGIKKQEADAKTAMVQVKSQEIAAKMAQAQQEAGGLGTGQPTFLDQLKAEEIQFKSNELQMKQQTDMMDALNRKRDRESRERLAAVKLAIEMGENPQAIPVVQGILQPDMIQRLESNEQPLTQE